MRALWVTLALAPVAGCTLYLGGDDGGDDTCPPSDYGGDGIALGYRNPQNGGCEYFGGGGGGGPCGYYDEPTAPPDWATCPSQCEGLGESTCLEVDGCRGAYLAFVDSDFQFLECWGTAPSGPIRGGSCVGLDAYGCSLHDDCAAVYDRDSVGYLSFGQCIGEPGVECTSDDQCPPGYSCTATGQCVGILDVCAAVDCGPGYECQAMCYPCDPPDGTGCEDGPYCEPVCVQI